MAWSIGADPYSAPDDPARPRPTVRSAHPAAGGAGAGGRGRPRRRSDRGRRAAGPVGWPGRSPCCARCRRPCWCMPRRRCAASACGRCPALTCWNCSPSCCRPAPWRPPRAAWRWRSTSPRPAPALPPPRRCCPIWRRRCWPGWRAGRDLPLNREAAALARRMGDAGWPWAQPVAAALAGRRRPPRRPLRAWRRLPDWEEAPPPPPPAAHPVAPAEARPRLAAMLGPGAEQRPGQADYADAAAAAFAAARGKRRPAYGARRSRHRHRQDPGLHRPRQPVGRAQQGRRCGSPPSPATCSARSRPNWPACTPTRPSAGAAWWCARGGRTTCAC